jgi:Ca2+-transporting ATPase
VTSISWRLYVRKAAQPAVLVELERFMAGGQAVVPQPVSAADTSIVEVVERAKTPVKTCGPEHMPPLGSLFCQCGTSEVERIFDTNVAHGLTKMQVEERRAHYGLNELPRTPPPPLIVVLAHQFTDFIVMLFIVVVILELSLQKWIPSAILLIVISFQVIVGFVQEVKAQKALRALESYTVQHATVLRAGEARVIPAAELVPGDIVKLEEGNVVPADMRLVEAVGLQVMEAVLTGESVSVDKSTDPIVDTSGIALGDMRNVAFMSTTVTHGRGDGIVTSIGKSTEVGKISKAIGKPK